MNEFKLKSITLENFRSFRKKQTFILDREPGLYYITGVNLDDIKLEWNGAGKSTLLNGILFCLYGRTAEDTKGPLLKSWNANTACKSILEFQKNNTLYTLTRTQGPNSLKINPPLSNRDAESEIITQTDIDNLIGLDFDKFLYAVIIGQFNSTFLDLGPTEKLNLFSDLMGLSIWEAASKDASTGAVDFQNSLNLLENQKTGIQSKVEALTAECGRLCASNDAFEAERQSTVSDLSNSKTDINAQLTTQEANERIINVSIKRTTSLIDKLTNDLERLNENISCINKNKTDYNGILNSYIKDKENVSLEFNKWKNIDTCPYCTTKVDSGIINTHKNHAVQQQVGISKEIKKIESAINSLLEQEQVNLSKIKETQEGLNDFKVKLTNSTAEHNQVLLQKNLTSQKLEQINKEIKKLINNANPYTQLKDKCQQELDNANKELYEIADKLSIVNKNILGTKFWVKGFKEIRQWLISDALDALEIESNNALSRLGLGDWVMRFVMERETKDDTISKGFQVLVHPPTAPKDTYIPFKTWSGGERQRLKLSGAKGLMELIKNYKGINFNIEFYDEPTNHLSPSGADDLIKLLSDHALSSGKAIYYIDHKSIESSYIKSIIKIEKKDNNSTILEGL